MADWQGVVSKNRIGNHSMNLLTVVATYREDDDTVSLNGLGCLGSEAHTRRTTALSSLSAIVWGVLSVRM